MTYLFLRACCLGILLFPVLSIFAIPTKNPPPIPIPAAPSSDVARALGNAFAGVAEKVSPSVVVITVTRGQGGSEEASDEQPDPFEYFFRKGPHQMPFSPHGQEPLAQGSGFIVRSNGYIYTNNHVIQGADKIKVKLKDGRTFDAHVVGIPDEKTDVAVIKIDARNLPVVEFGDSDAIRPGEWTIAIGAPFNLDYSVTVGVLSGKVRDRLGATTYEEYLQTQATINPGNSGGPLLDIDGKVVGINTLIKTRQGMGFSFYNANVGFAIPIKLARMVGDLLITKGKVERPWLGVEISDDSEIKKSIKGITQGVVIMTIRPDTPAYQSGLKPGDVITSIDGVAVGTAKDLQKQVLGKKIGQTVHLSVMRNGSPLTVEIQTGLQPSTQQVSSHISPPQSLPDPPTHGMVLQPLTRELIEQFDLTEKQGLLVMDVDENSHASRCGLIPGMVITEVDGKKVSSIKAFKDAFRKADLKRGVLIQVSKGGIRSFVILRVNPSSSLENN